MRKIIAILIFCLSTFVAKAGSPTQGSANIVFYPTFGYGDGYDGGKVLNNDGIETELNYGTSFKFGSFDYARCVGYAEKGDCLYRQNFQSGWVNYVVSADGRHMSQSVYTYGQLRYTTFYTSSRDEQQAYYAANKHKQTGGITFDSSWGDSNGSSLSSQEKSTCSHCGGTGVNPSSTNIDCYTSWLKYYSYSKSKCPYCSKLSRHYHDRCSFCMGSGRE